MSTGNSPPPPVRKAEDLAGHEATPILDVLGRSLTFTFYVEAQRPVANSMAAKGHQRSVSEPLQKTASVVVPLVDPETHQPVQITTFESLWRHLNFLDITKLRSVADSGLHFFVNGPYHPSWEALPDGASFKLIDPKDPSQPLTGAFHRLCAALVVSRMYAKAEPGSHHQSMPLAHLVVGISAGFGCLKVWLRDTQAQDHIAVRRDFSKYFEQHIGKRLQASYVVHKLRLQTLAPLSLHSAPDKDHPYQSKTPTAKPSTGWTTHSASNSRVSAGSFSHTSSSSLSAIPSFAIKRSHERTESFASIGSSVNSAKDGRRRRGCRGGKSKSGKRSKSGSSIGDGEEEDDDGEGSVEGSRTASDPIPIALGKHDEDAFAFAGDSDDFALHQSSEAQLLLPVSGPGAHPELPMRPTLITLAERDDDELSIVERSVDDEEVQPQYAGFDRSFDPSLTQMPSTPGILVKGGEKRRKGHTRSVSFGESQDKGTALPRKGDSSANLTQSPTIASQPAAPECLPTLNLPAAIKASLALEGSTRSSSSDSDPNLKGKAEPPGSPNRRGSAGSVPAPIPRRDSVPLTAPGAVAPTDSPAPASEGPELSPVEVEETEVFAQESILTPEPLEKVSTGSFAEAMSTPPPLSPMTPEKPAQNAPESGSEDHPTTEPQTFAGLESEATGEREHANLSPPDPRCDTPPPEAAKSQRTKGRGSGKRGKKKGTEVVAIAGVGHVKPPAAIRRSPTSAALSPSKGAKLIQIRQGSMLNNQAATLVAASALLPHRSGLNATPLLIVFVFISGVVFAVVSMRWLQVS